MIVIEQRKHKSKEREKHIAIMIVAGPVFVTRRYETWYGVRAGLAASAGHKGTIYYVRREWMFLQTNTDSPKKRKDGMEV